LLIKLSTEALYVHLLSRISVKSSPIHYSVA